MRLCIDYRRLKSVTIRDSYSIQIMDKWIDSVGEATIFTTIDCNYGSFQINIDENGREKTSFSSLSGHYRFTTLLFGLLNAPSTLKSVPDVILSNVKWNIALAHLDDLRFYSRSTHENHQHVLKVLELLHEVGFTLCLKSAIYSRI